MKNEKIIVIFIISLGLIYVIKSVWSSGHTQNSYSEVVYLDSQTQNEGITGEEDRPYEGVPLWVKLANTLKIVKQQNATNQEESDDYFSDDEDSDGSDNDDKTSDSKKSKSVKIKKIDSINEPGAGRLFSGTDQESNLTWPLRFEDYAPLEPATLARKILDDRGKTLLKKVPNFAFKRSTGWKPPSFSSGIHVVTTFFHGAYHARRFSEIVATLIANLENPYIKAVHILWEKENPAMYITNEKLLDKLILTEIKTQPTYAKLFQYINDTLKRGSIAIVTNADIYFDSSLRCLRTVTPQHDHWNLTSVPEITKRRGLVLALSRRHTALCGENRNDFKGLFDLCKQYIQSHDAFIFAPPVHSRVIKNTNHLQNRYGAENIVIWEFIKSGSIVQNPCKKLHAIHLHCTNERYRHYERKFIDGSTGSGPYRHGVCYPGTQMTTVEPNRKNGIGTPCGTVIY